MAALTPRTLMAGARPRNSLAHLVDDMLLVAETTTLYSLPPKGLSEIATALEHGDDETASVLDRLGLAARPDTPITEPALGSVRALALTVSQSCNLACTYCYAAGGSFGQPETRMNWSVAQRAIDELISGTVPGGSVKIAFMGGEPMIERDLIYRSVAYARKRAAARAIGVGFSLTTNATLVKPEDAAFFADQGFAVTVSLDGGKKANDTLRPMRGGAGSFERVIARLAPLIEHSDRIALSARMTATPSNLDLAHNVDALGKLGFASVGVSPMITSPTGTGTLSAEDFETLLGAMVACGQDWLNAAMRGQEHPFANLRTALTELHRGQPRSHSCGAVRDYLAVDARGKYAACHRFVNDPLGEMGSLDAGIDHAGRTQWLAERSVEQQTPCQTCWARRLCGGGCHHEVLNAGRPACDFVRGWLRFAIGAYGQLMAARPEWFDALD